LIGRSGYSEFTPDLIKALRRDPSEDVREHAADALAYFPDNDEVLLALEGALNDTSEGVGASASTSLSSLRRKP